MPAPAANAEALLDMFLFGESPEGKPEIHLTFKDDVLRGATLQLVKEEAGYDAIFTVGDDTVRRHLEGELERLVQRLQARGMTVKSWRVHVSS
jgi:hypothetical protein